MEQTAALTGASEKVAPLGCLSHRDGARERGVGKTSVSGAYDGSRDGRRKFSAADGWAWQEMQVFASNVCSVQRTAGQKYFKSAHAQSLFSFRIAEMVWIFIANPQSHDLYAKISFDESQTNARQKSDISFWLWYFILTLIFHFGSALVGPLFHSKKHCHC